MDIKTIVESFTNPLNIFFISIIILLSIVSFKKKIDFKSQIVSVGILGTFVGIFIGLLNFDTSNLRSSIIHLLDGMKTAFLSSIFGMGAAVLLSILENWKYKNREVDNNKDFFYKQIEILNNINKNVENSIKEQKSSFSTLNKKLDNIELSLNEAIKSLSTSATEEIVKALEDVVKKFNEQIEIQFGENLRKFSNSVDNLLYWQEKNKEYMEKLIRAFSVLLKILKDFSNQTDKILGVHKNLEKILKENEKQIENLNEKLEKLSELNTFIKDFKSNLDDTLNKINEANSKIANSISTSSQRIEGLINLIKISIDKLNKDIKESHNEHLEIVKNTLNRTSSDIKDTFNNTIENISSEVDKFIREVEEQINLLEKLVNNSISLVEKETQTLGKIIDNLKLMEDLLKNASKDLNEINQQIPSALENSLRYLDRGLASLTKKFMEDYENILNKYKDNLDRNR